MSGDIITGRLLTDTEELRSHGEDFPKRFPQYQGNVVFMPMQEKIAKVERE